MRLRYRNNGKRTVLVSRPFVMVNFDSSGLKVELLLADGRTKTIGEAIISRIFY